MATPVHAPTTSLAIRLIALVLVPLVGFATFAVGGIRTEQAAAARAEEIARTAELQQVVAQLYPLAQLEQIALEGLARMDELGLPRDFVVALSGIDLESVYETNRTELDTTLDQLASGYGSIELADGSTLGIRIRSVQLELAMERALSTQHEATSDDVHATITHLEDLLTELLDGLQFGDNANDLAGRSVQLDTLAHALSSAGERADIVMRSLLYRTDELAEEATELGRTHLAYLEAHGAALPPDERAAFDEIVAWSETLSQPEFVDGQDTETVNAAMVVESAQLILDHLDYLSRLQNYSADLHARVTTEARDNLALARTAERRSIVLLIGLSIATTLLVAAVLWSVLVPLRRLTRRAAAISRGELDHEPLRLTGPSDFRSLIGTTNDLVATLGVMRTGMARLATGDVTNHDLPDLPGAIGVSMRESFDRLSMVTHQLHRSEEFASAIVDEAADAIWTVDTSNLIRSANTAAARMGGIPVDEQIGMDVNEILITIDGETMISAPDGRRTRVLAVSSIVDLDAERFTTVIAHDISERTRFEEQLAYQASHDALTGLPNRFSLLRHLDERVEHGDDVAVLFVDLDGFKSVNDIHGHAVGDQVLAEVARKLSACVGEHDFIGRLGGDEFVIVADGNSADDAVVFGGRVIAAIERPHSIAGHTFTLSASVGIALPTAGTPSLDTIRQADNAVYQAKRRGRGRVEVYDVTLQGRIEHEAELDLALRNAPLNDELVLHLQPVVDLASNDVVTVEALVRWNRPDRGLVMPSDFVPIAERSSVIFDIERWVLHAACERVVAWRRRDPSCRFRISVNISGRHLIDGNLIGDVEQALADTGADPNMLELELTETQLLEDVPRATAILTSLRSRGITIAVDDFGTGYSSLTYLRHLPLDSVKIDRSFVAHATEEGYDSTVIDALLTISRRLELSVVAEGVETTEQLSYLRTRGCDRAQGYLLARPLPADELERLLFDRASSEARPVAVRIIASQPA